MDDLLLADLVACSPLRSTSHSTALVSMMNLSADAAMALSTGSIVHREVLAGFELPTTNLAGSVLF